MRFNNYAIVSLLLLILFPQGCANKSKTNPHPGVPDLSSNENEQKTVVPVSLPEYRLGFGDVIEIKFFNKSQFNELVKVRPDGRISMERIGELQVVGLTPLQLDEIITREFSKIIENPEVTVVVREFSKENIYVLGEVNRPGGYPVERGMTLLRAITMAGGYTPAAKMNSVILIRKKNFSEPEATRIDLTDVISKNNLAKDSIVEPNDIIFIPRTFIAQMNNFVERFFTRLIYPPLDIYLRSLFYSRVWR